MSIPEDQVPITNCTGTGVATEFSYEFYAPDIRDVFVEIGGTLVDEAEWKAVKDSDSTGRIIFNTAPEDGAEIKIYRSTPITQETVWQQGQAFYADTVMSAFDKITMIAQEQRGGEVNVPGTVVTAHSATYAASATYADSATRAGSAATAGSASGLTAAAKIDILNSAAYNGPFKATYGGFTPGLRYINISSGGISMNGSSYPVESGRVSVPDTGGTAYLVGTSSGTGYSFSYTGTEPTSAAGQFYAPIASFADNTVKQIQFGNVTDVTLGGGGVSPETVSSALSAGIASGVTDDAKADIYASAGIGATIEGGSATVTLTGGTGAVVFKGAGAAAITSGSDGEVVISAAGGGAASVPMILYGAGSSLSVGSGNLHFNYTTSSGDPGGRMTVGTGLGGVILGTAKMPLESDEDDTLTIYLTTGEYGTYHTLLTGIDTHGPRNTFISIPLGPDTDFSLEADGTYGTTTAEYNLTFYPYSFNN